MITMAAPNSTANPREKVRWTIFTPRTRMILYPYVASPSTMPTPPASARIRLGLGSARPSCQHWPSPSAGQAWSIPNALNLCQPGMHLLSQV